MQKAVLSGKESTAFFTEKVMTGGNFFIEK